MTDMSSSTFVVRRAAARRVARRAKAGFTLIEMMVALTIGALVIASVYTIGASAARHFQEQQRISQVQLSVRLALDRIRRDVARAGFNGTMNSLGDPVCGPPPGTQVRGLRVVHGHAPTTTALTTMSGYTAATSHGDMVEITGNFRTGDAFLVREWVGNQLQLATNYTSYRRTFSADPTGPTIDTNLVAQTFPVNTQLMARIGGGMRIWSRVASVTANSLATSATITTATSAPSCPQAIGMEGWAQGGVTVAPISMVRYEIVNAATLIGMGLAPRSAAVVGTNTVLTRTEVNPLTGAILDGPAPLLEFAVHFDVDVFADTAAGTGASVIDLFDDTNATLRTMNNPGTIRGVRISLAARTPEQDPHLTQTMTALGDGTPRVFRVFAGRDGAARVRSAYTEVFIPNSALN